MSAGQYRCSKQEIEGKLDGVVGKTLGEVDVAHVFDITKANPKVTGIAGAVVEQSVIGYPANSNQEPDLVVDGVEVELKTTGLRESRATKGLEAKEPMSITAVSLGTISGETFDTSNFWHKARRMLLVYYLYDSPAKVQAADYASFPIKGYQFHEFTAEERETLRNDWQLVHDFVKAIQDEHPDEGSREALYPQLSSALRDRLMMIDTAPKYPHPPRFRLKRSTVTAIARKSFGDSMEQLPKAYTSFDQVDAVLHDVACAYRGRSLGDLARGLGMSERVSKGTIERVVCRMFGAKSSRMAEVEAFARAGLKAKSVVLDSNGGRTEDMKLFTIDFDEFLGPEEPSFEESPIRDWFVGGPLVCIVLQEPGHAAPLSENVFLGFKRVSFDDGFVTGEVGRTYADIARLIRSHELRFVPETDKRTGNPVVNKTGVVRGAPNFPKSNDHIVFVRGTSSDSTRKPLCIDGVQMYSQQLWVKGTWMAARLKQERWI